MNSYVPKDDFGLLIFLPLPPECRYYRYGTNFPGRRGRSGISLWDSAVEAPGFPSPLLFREPAPVVSSAMKCKCDFLASTIQANMELGEVKGSHEVPLPLSYAVFILRHGVGAVLNLMCSQGRS